MGEVKNQQDSLLEDLLKKAEQKVNESKSETGKTDYITEEMNEEISWALEMKKQHAESGKVTSHNEEKKKEPEEKKELSQFEKMRLLKEKEAEEKKKLNAKPSDAESLANLSKAMEQKAEKKKVAKEKRMEPEKLKQEEKSIEDAMSEEIQWLLNRREWPQKRHRGKRAKTRKRSFKKRRTRGL